MNEILRSGFLACRVRDLRLVEGIRVRPKAADGKSKGADGEEVSPK